MADSTNLFTFGQKKGANDDYDGHWVLDRYHSHDAWLHWGVTSRCNLKCVYCISHDADNEAKELPPPINIPALLRTLDEANKTFKIRFTGGEPFLIPNFVEACIKITEKHYIGINTNLACNNVEEFAEKVNPERVTNINASIHIKELERCNLIEKVIDNFLLCKKKGFNIVSSVVAYPPLLREIEKYKNFFNEKGIKLNFSFFIGEYNGKEYPKSYTDEEIEKFGLNKIWLKKYYQYRGICNAGYNVGMVNSSGDVQPCFYIAETMGNVYEKITFKKNLTMCPVKHCTCPVKQIDPYLFKRSLEENSTFFKKIIPIVKFPSVAIPKLLRKLGSKIKKRDHVG